METEPQSTSERAPAVIRAPIRTAVVLFLFLNFTYLLTSTGRVHVIDEISAVMQAESLVTRGSTAIPQAVGSGIYYGKKDLHGQARSPYPPGHPLAIAPWYWLGQHLVAPLARAPQGTFDLLMSMVCTWSSATFAAAAVAFAFLLAFALGAEVREALIVAAVLGLASPLFVYSGWLFSEPLTAALWMAAALALFGIRQDEEISWQRALIAGVLLGASLHVRPTNLIAAAIFLAGMLIRGRRRDWRPVLITAAVVGLAGLAYLARNASLYGNALDFGYPTLAEGGRELNTFHTPLLVGLTGFLVSPGKSIFLFFPAVLLAIGGVFKLWRRDRGLAIVCGATPLVYMLFYARYTQWEGIYCYGPRYLVPPLALLGVAVTMQFVERRQWLPEVLGLLLVAGVMVQLVGLSTNIMEDMVRHQYYYANWEYRWSYSAITGQMALIAKYLGGAPAPLGYGFDRWFLFLYKAGAPASGVLTLLAPMLGGFLASGWLLWREWCKFES